MLTAIGQVSLLAAVLAYAAVLALAALIPGAVEIADPSAVSSEAGHSIRDNAVRQMADALPDPCLILDRRSSIVHRNAAARRIARLAKAVAHPAPAAQSKA